MMTTLPPTEDRRIHALDSLGALHTPPSPTLDALVALTSVEVVAPLVRLDLVDRFRVVPKAVCGGPATVLPRRNAFAAEVVRTGRVLVVPDLMRAPRWRDHPDVHRSPGARMCIAMPIRTSEGEVVGALVAIDVLPRNLDRTTIERMFHLTCQAAEQLHRERPSQLAPEESATELIPIIHRELHLVDGGRHAVPSIWHEARTHVVHPTTDPVAFIGRDGFLSAHRGAWDAVGVQPCVGDSVASLVAPAHRKRTIQALRAALAEGSATVRVALDSSHQGGVSLTFVRRPLDGGGTGIFLHLHEPDIAGLASRRVHRLYHGVVPADDSCPLAAR